MPTFKDLKELIDTAIGWENKLTGFYDQVLDATDHAACQDLITLLKTRHLDHLAMLCGIDVKAFGADEWIQCVPDMNPSELLSISGQPGDVSPRAMVERIVDFERQVQEFYRCIAELVSTRDERELFESLARTKERSMFEIISCLEYSGGAL